MNNFIVNQIPAATLQAIKQAVANQITAANQYKVGLSDAEKSGLRTMAFGREGFARTVNKIAQTHVNSLARELNPTDLDAKLNYDAALEDIRQQTMALLELITETQLANSADIMSLVDKMVANLQTSRTGNASLDLAMREVDEWNSRFSNSGNNTEKKNTTE